MMVDYDVVVARAVKSLGVPVYHNTAPETGENYPFIVYRTLSVSPDMHADDKFISYQHSVRVTIVSNNNEPVKALETAVIEAMVAADYMWQTTNPSVESREYGETYTAIDFICEYFI